jgi:DNA-binding IclR family transcriptional regulator
VASLSAPVFDYRGQIVAGISTLGAGLQGDFDSKASGTIGKKLKKAADELSRRLGHTAPLNEQPAEVETIPVKA